MKNIITNLFCIFAAITLTSTVHAQRAKVVYAEAFGSGGAYSLNFDTRFKAQPYGLGARVGIAGYGDGGSVSLVYPVQVNYVTKGKHALELGVGATVLSDLALDDNDGTEIIPAASIMYRFQANNGLNIRAGITPLLIPDDNNGFVDDEKDQWLLIWPGLSIGYRF